MRWMVSIAKASTFPVRFFRRLLIRVIPSLSGPPPQFPSSSRTAQPFVSTAQPGRLHSSTRISHCSADGFSAGSISKVPLCSQKSPQAEAALFCSVSVLNIGRNRKSPTSSSSTHCFTPVPSQPYWGPRRHRLCHKQPIAKEERNESEIRHSLWLLSLPLASS